MYFSQLLVFGINCAFAGESKRTNTSLTQWNWSQSLPRYSEKSVSGTHRGTYGDDGKVLWYKPNHTKRITERSGQPNRRQFNL